MKKPTTAIYHYLPLQRKTRMKQQNANSTFPNTYSMFLKIPSFPYFQTNTQSNKNNLFKHTRMTVSTKATKTLWGNAYIQIQL